SYHTLTYASFSLLHRGSSLWSRNSYCYHRPFIVPYLTWNWCICSTFCLVQYKVGCCWYVHGNRFCSWSGFTWLFNTISRSEDILFSDWNVMGSARHSDSSLRYITEYSYLGQEVQQK